MPGKTESEQPAGTINGRKGHFQFSIHVRIFIVIISVALVITVSALAAGAWFLTRSIRGALEEDMLVSVDIADQYVTKEIELLKIRAADIAKNISVLYSEGRREGVLEKAGTENPNYTGLAVFNHTALLDSWGNLNIPPDLYREPFMQIAMTGGGAVSTTMYCPDGSLVMYVSAHISGDLVLAAILPGLYLSNIISGFTFWQSGHLFIDDADGHVISNYRTEWVEQRINFIDLAKTDTSYKGLSSMVSRGIAGERGTGKFSLNGIPRLCAFRPVSSPDLGWFVGIIAPLSESAFQNIPGSLLLMGLIMLLMSLVAAFLAAVILKRPYEEADQLRKAAEIASISKSAFLANMSHEIRTPMNSIVGFSELALDSEVSLKTRDYLEKIKTNAEWLLQIINDILDISKVESGRIELEKIPFDMHELFSSCRNLILPKAVEKGIALYFYAEPNIDKRPLGDPTRLRQVLVNLLSNAVKFTNTGIVKLHANLKEIYDNSFTMVFEIKDSGIGMTPEQLENIFDPFAQAESGTTRKYGGAGLGLPITKNIIERMGGELLVESTSGVGSKFSFELTFDTIDVTADEMFEKKIVLSDIEKPTFEGEVLLCEDNVMNQHVICEHLERIGLKAVVAENGKIGLDMVKSRFERGEKQFDLIFMDMHMPVMDGLEASSKIFELNTGVPIIALTANVMANDREIYRMSGMYDCVGKPFTSQELWHCLMKYLTPVSFQSGNAKKTPNNAEYQIETDVKFQRELQSLFVRTNRTKYEEIVNARKTGDIKLAHRLAHTLKSNAGQLGKTLLQQAAAALEHQLAGIEDLATEEQMSLLKTELDAVLFSLANVRPSAEAKTEAGQELLDNESVQKLFEKLEPMLKMGNPECRKLIESIKRIQESDGLKIKLIQQMEDFDFDPAIFTLTELKKKLETG